MLKVQDLVTHYGGSQALFGVDFDIGTGEVATLLGRNGMGKTTTIKVLATTTIPQGIAALLAFNTEVDLETSITAMKKAQSAVRSIAITQAARSVRLVGLHIKKKQPIGFLDGDLVAASDSATDTLNEVLSKLNLSDAEIITILERLSVQRAKIHLALLSSFTTLTLSAMQIAAHST